MNDDIIVGPNWLTEMVASFNLYWDNVGVVGAKLLMPDKKARHPRFPQNWFDNVGTMQHAGVYLIRDLRATHVYKNKPADWLAANYLREYEAVTFGLVGIDMECYSSVRLDEKYDADLNDMDFCIRAKKKGWRTIYNPNCIAYHLESVTRFEQKNAGKIDNHREFAKQYADLLKDKMTSRELRAFEAEGL